MEAIKNHTLPFDLKQVPLKDLVHLKRNQFPLYAFHQEMFLKVLNRQSVINNTFLMNYQKSYGTSIFIFKEDYIELQNNLKVDILRLSRSISLGDPRKNGLKLSSLLTKNLSLLYANPFDDDLLKFQHQHTKNFGLFLFNQPKVHKELYHKSLLAKQHYIHKHPLLSSIFLLSFLLENKTFNKQEILSLFMTNYFKDIGMSQIDENSLNSKQLNSIEKKALSKHSQYSLEILKGRIPLSHDHLQIIENHHFLNDKVQSFINKKSQESDQDKEHFLLGLESTIITAVDIFVALTTERPYRPAKNTFETLQIIKHILSNDYAQEYKELVIFINKFLSK